MAHLVLKYIGGGKFAAGWPASDLTDADVAERARERGLSEAAYLAEALALQGFYQRVRASAPEREDVQPAAPAQAAPGEPRRKG